MTKIIRTLVLGIVGGFIYYIIELLWRGYSHPSMYILGGLCFVLLGGINEFFPWELGLVWQALIGAAVVTLAELLCGCVVNLWLGLGVWDYSNQPMNLLGQVCLLYSLLWVPLSVVGITLDDRLRYVLYGEEKPRYTWWQLTIDN